ncbi:MAG TPA: STAS domain-containing protein [Burkholderiales bacterium]
MVFSRFTKKDNEPSKTVKPAPAKPASAKPSSGSSRPAPSLTPSAKATVDKIDQIEAEMMELDFTKSSAAPAPAPAEKRPAEKPALDLTPPAPSAAPARPAIEHGFNPGARPASAKPAAPAKPAAAPAARGAPPAPAPKNPAPAVQGVASVMMMEVQESPFESSPVLEEAAILYANHQDDAALAALEDAARDKSLPNAPARQAWLLLFDLYENLGLREAFEEAAVQFAMRFETSPPAFNDRSKVKDPNLMTGGGQYFAFTGHIDNNAGKQFEQLKKTAAKDNVLRVEFGKIDTVSGEGAEMLLAFLKDYKKTGKDLVFSNADHLIKLLNGMIDTGRNTDAESLWLLLLDMYQLQYMQTAFEETALNYCITYEVSPPSWVEPKKAPTNTPAPAPVVLQVPQDAFYMKGEIEGSADDIFKAAGEYAADKALVVIDVFDVKRMDFIAGGSFLNLVSSLRAQGKRIEIRHPSPLINALLVTMGFTAQITVTKRNR